MPPKGHRATGPLRTHSRSSSGGSSKVAVNLQFTQKDQVAQKQGEKPRRNGHATEPQTRNVAQCPRGSGGARVASRERHHRHPLPSNTKGKGFTIASISADEDDEWVSSESGAATPNKPDLDNSRSPTPIDHRNGLSYNELAYRADTPRAQHPPPPMSLSLSRASSSLPPQSQDEARSAATAGAALSRVPLSPSEHSQEPRFVASPPLLRNPCRHLTSTRPPSACTVTSRSDGSSHLHPLIRGQPFGPVHTRLEPLEPLTITSEVSSVQTSTSPTYGVGQPSTSPSSVRTAYAGPSSNRRTSVSSVRSVVTLPNQAYHLGKERVRDRTLSSMSSTSSGSVQALASLAHLPTSRPSTPQYSVRFSPATLSASLEAVHPLLPPPYLSIHMSILGHQSPLRESYDRVIATRG